VRRWAISFRAGRRNSGQTVELTLAAAEVVFCRMSLGGFAMVNPAGADHHKFARMVPEKTRAFSDASSILNSRAAQIGQEVTQFEQAPGEGRGGSRDIRSSQYRRPFVT
jgi:hypothetical protein